MSNINYMQALGAVSGLGLMPIVHRAPRFSDMMNEPEHYSGGRSRYRGRTTEGEPGTKLVKACKKGRLGLSNPGGVVSAAMRQMTRDKNLAAMNNGERVRHA